MSNKHTSIPSLDEINGVITLATRNLSKVFEKALELKKKPRLIELIDANSYFNAFVSVVPFKPDDTIYYHSVNTAYPRIVYKQTPNSPGESSAPIGVGLMDKCTKTGSDYYLLGGERISVPKIEVVK